MLIIGSVNLADFQVLFYLPVYFQSVHAQSAISSGVHSLPFMAFFAFGAILSGGLVGKTGLAQPFALIGSLLATAGSALLYTLEIDSSQARYVGPQVLFGFGIGLGNQIGMMIVQAFSNPADVASTTAVMLSTSGLPSLTGHKVLAVLTRVQCATPWLEPTS